MECKLLYCSAILLTLGLGPVQAQEHVTSAYSSLYGKNCTLEFVEKITGASITRCAGVGGFQLLVASDDERMSVSVVDPSKKEHPLNYWEVVTPAMATLDDTAEWRVVKGRKGIVPVALIVGVKSLDQSDPDRPKKIPLIAIAKITDRETCVVAVIPNCKKATEKARKEADEAGNKVCLTAP